jgi:hypothetical protein
MPDLESIAKEMFPKEYADITDDRPMDPEKVQKAKAELHHRMAIRVSLDIMIIIHDSILSRGNPVVAQSDIKELLERNVKEWKVT